MTHRRSIGDDLGSVAAEFAVVVPAVVLIVALAAATLAGTSRQVRLEQAAAQGARLAARGEGDGRVREAVAVLVSGARVAIGSDGDFDCVDVSAPSGVPLPLPALTARSCALSGGL
ncbi:MAG: TadE family type IV pilus minor pilin [Candidatus Microbacterium phytovorans]|uniref:TadE family type IV pilus minor pilin n=1 Tax=Candidatus Microbacterium phytovorans TaxID=3121374 RepID=A0AAJ5VY93_9MICO|nr:TadE family type IV pilus minor pilin [Microbacterium sp.]WEK12372.1 MAG: TadE family type IV pilus minor pilin [Microbacterium sp.]